MKLLDAVSVTIMRHGTVLFFLQLLSYVFAQSGCQLLLTRDIPTEDDPVYVISANSQLQLALPATSSIDLSPNQELLLACLGRNNYLPDSNEVLTSSRCSSGSQLIVNNQIKEAKNLTCNARSKGETRLGSQCIPTDGTNVESTFVVDGQSLTLINSCHNLEIANTYWSNHILYGTKLEYEVKSTASRPSFTKGVVFKSFSPDNAYKQQTQADTFVKIYNRSDYINPSESLYLARGHLAPDADFLFPSWQGLSYFYVNTAPQWQSINNGNWKVVENTARELAIKKKADLEVYTGTSGVLKLPSSSGTLEEAYLESGGIPVPDLIWKLLRNPDDSSCIAIIITNNPYLESSPTNTCTDVCAQAGWPIFQSDLQKGYVWCCEYNSFKTLIPESPPSICSSLLIF